ncbi:MAG: hypothetical protein CUN53_02400 [Phototrophicales bacterium]|nr:MAG: hypothetical protein CUN53_02400 [Phototrophicales bacterium]
MMPSQSVFRWLDGRGWLVLAGAGDPASESDFSEIRAKALGRMAADGAAAVVFLGEASGADALLDDIEDLGAPSGYLVDIVTEDDETIRNRLTEAGMIVISGASSGAAARSALLGAAIDGIRAAYENGAIILVEGAASGAFGAYLLDADGTVSAGLGWLMNALILPGMASIGQAALPVLSVHPEAVGVGIGSGAALALGGDGEVEIWGARRVSVALGSAYQGGQTG